MNGHLDQVLGDLPVESFSNCSGIIRPDHATYADQFRREIETQAEIRLSADALEGRKAFLEKRTARFSGR